MLFRSAAAINTGVKESNAEFIIISNNDVLYHPNSIEVLVSYLIKNRDVGIVGPQQFYLDGKWQYSYGNLPGWLLAFKNIFIINTFQHIFNSLIWSKFKFKKVKEVGYLDGAVLVVRKSAFSQVNGFDEDYFFYTEEADFCYRLKKNNWKIVHNPNATVTHLRGATTSDSNYFTNIVEKFCSSKSLFCKKHLSRFETKFYVTSELLNTFIMLITWNLINFFLPDKLKNKAEFKINFFKPQVSQWLIEYKKLN